MLAAEVVGGIALGVALPLTVLVMARLSKVDRSDALQPLGPVAVAILLYSLTSLTHANGYLAAFAAGSTIATLAPRIRGAFEEFGDLVAELLKLAALLVFGALLTPGLFTDLPLGSWAVAVLALVLVRPASLLLSLMRTRLDRREKAAIAWFGPKGFASVVYGLLVLGSGIPDSDVVSSWSLSASLSIVAHSSTDLPVAKLFASRTR